MQKAVMRVAGRSLDNGIKRLCVLKTTLIPAAVAAALPILAGAAEWHMVPDEVYPDVPLSRGPVIGAVLADSIRKNGDHAEAQVSMFYKDDLVQTALEAFTKPSAKYSELISKLDAAIPSGRLDAYTGTERLFLDRGFVFPIGSSYEEIRLLLVASEILLDEGYAPMSTRTVQVICKSKLDFEYRYDGSGSWSLSSLPSDGSAGRGELYPFICDKVGMGQNERVLAPPTTPEMALLQEILSGEVLPKWKLVGVKTDGDGHRFYVLFAADTIKKKKAYTDVVVGSVQVLPSLDLSGFQEGRYRPRSLNISHVHVHCDTKDIGDDFSGGVETQVVSSVCVHEQEQPTHATKRH